MPRGGSGAGEGGEAEADPQPFLPAHRLLGVVGDGRLHRLRLARRDETVHRAGGQEQDAAGLAQLLQAQLKDPALLRHAEVIEKAAVDGAETVRRMQEIGRQDHVDDFVPVRLRAILDDVAELTLPRWRDLPKKEGRSVELRVAVESLAAG